MDQTVQKIRPFPVIKWVHFIVLFQMLIGREIVGRYKVVVQEQHKEPKSTNNGQEKDQDYACVVCRPYRICVSGGRR